MAAGKSGTGNNYSNEPGMDELNRQRRVIDMMITAHAVLKDRYNAAASFFEVSLLICSVILNTLIFVDANFVQKFTGLTEDQQKLIIGLSCLAVFIISIVMLQVAWREKGSSHANAAQQLFALKQEAREIGALPDDPGKQLMINEFNKKYGQITNMLIKIPDKQFNALKLVHARKVELSKMIDKYPGSRLWILKIRLCLASFKEKT